MATQKQAQRRTTPAQRRKAIQERQRKEDRAIFNKHPTYEMLRRPYRRGEAPDGLIVPRAVTEVLILRVKDAKTTENNPSQREAIALCECEEHDPPIHKHGALPRWRQHDPREDGDTEGFVVALPEKGVR